MRSRLSLNALVVGVALVTAVTLTFVHRTPSGVVSFSVKPQEVRAEPGAPPVVKHDLSALKIFNLTLVRLKENYVDPTRIDPKQMLYKALDSVQFNVPEVLVEAFPDRDELVVVVNDQRQTFSTEDVDSPWRLARKLTKVFRFVEANMNSGADLAAVEYAAINGMLSTLDPHSVLMDPEAAREMDVSTSGKFGGLGIVIRMIDKKLTVVRPMKNTPAWKKGVQAGDHIVKIDSEPTENLTLNEAVDRMRGDPGTPVTLTIDRKGAAAPVRVDLVRDVIRVESVVSKLLDKHVGYVKLKQFSSSTGAETERALDDLRAQGATAWVLDLRGNPGGLLEQAIAVADLFVDAGTIVTTVSGREREPRRAGRGNGDTASPLVVLVNSGSASASEIVAGALKNLDRGLIVGTRTFGKGSVQVLYDNEDGSKLKLTVAEYLTPGDRSIQSLGIVPDVALQRMYVPAKNDAVGDWFRLLPPSRTWGEKDLDAHLTSAYARDTDKPSYDVPFLYERPAAKAKAAAGGDDDEAAPPEDEDADQVDDDEVVEDFEIRFARDLVASASAATRTGLVKQVKAMVGKERGEQDKKLGAALGQLGIDWSAPPANQNEAPTLVATVTTPKAEVAAGDEIVLTGTVRNDGAGPAWRVLARVDSDDPVFEDTELVFGKIAPGETRTFTARVKLPKDASDRVERLGFVYSEGRGQAVEAAPLELRVDAAPRPTFAYGYQLLDDGNGDGLVQPKERHRLRVTVKNAGAGVSEETTAVLRNASGDGVVLDRSRFELGTLAPGATKTVEFDFDVTKALQGNEVVVELMIWDNVLGATASEKLRFPIDKAVTVKDAKGVVETRAQAPIREGAGDATNLVGWAKKGTRFKVLAIAGTWTKVELEPGRAGFIATGKVARSSGSAGPATIDPYWQVTPPAITITAPTLATAAATYDLAGKVKDETHVEDVYVYVSNSTAKIDGRKIYYRSNRGAKTKDQLAFDVEVPLWPGSNQITVVARESSEVRSVETFYVYREDAKTAAK
ncbi:MAG: PDZ domain-containing protein [Kofleriaceae bacterium]|nr:PDZ domain-containing protein [Kofleriaceae bacterium]